jgi:hypothetical protein
VRGQLDLGEAAGADRLVQVVLRIESILDAFLVDSRLKSTCTYIRYYPRVK